MLKNLLCLAVALSVLCSFAQPLAAAAEQAVTEEQALAAYQLLRSELNSEQTAYLDYLLDAPQPPGTGSSLAWPGAEGQTLRMKSGGEATYRLTAERAGWYWLFLDYRPRGDTMSDFSLSLRVNGQRPYEELDSLLLPLYWTDGEEGFPRDSYGDESAPRQKRLDRWRSQGVTSAQRVTANPLVIPLREGENTLVFTSTGPDGLELGRIEARAPVTDLPDYQGYAAAMAGTPPGQGLIAVNATGYLEKNDLRVVYRSVNDPGLTPHESGRKLINTLALGGAGEMAQVQGAGMEITYELQVDTAGRYAIALNYRSDKPEYDTFLSFLLDGRAPFKECLNYPLASTRGRFDLHTLGSPAGRPYLFYLDEGRHTLTVRVEMEPVARALRYARLMSAHVMDFYLRITQLAGSQRDSNRTWKMTRYLPRIADYLDAYQTLALYLRQTAALHAGSSGAVLGEVDKMLRFIREMQRYPDDIALYTAQLTGPDNSLLVYLSRFSSQLAANALSLDMFYLLGEGQQAPRKGGGMEKAGNWLSTLLHTFTTDKYRQKAGEGEELTVWVNRALSHVDLLQKLVDTDFTQKTGIKVKLSAMTDAGRLTLAAAAGTTPDLALGLASYMPFDLASRGALLDLTQFPDFWQVASRMPAGAFVPYLFNEGVYAVPETLDFACLVYRKDIFDRFGLAPPDTWEEVIALLPELQRHGMNFFHNISQGVGYKWFYQTTPLIYQHGGALYTQDGLRTAIDQPEAISGIQALGNLFIAYSLSKQVTSFFDSFRYAVQPVGIIDAATYILLLNGAPELQGRWALAPYPGTPQADGSVSRWFVANGQGGIVFRDTGKPDEAWAFLKWWLSRETQVTYSFLLKSTYGSAFLWLPSNLEALSDAPIARADLNVILDSTVWLRDVPRTPGQYLLERSLSDIWNAMVTRGVSAQVAVDEKAVLINREIRKKMAELGFYNQAGEMVRPYVIRDIDWVRQQMAPYLQEEP